MLKRWIWNYLWVWLVNYEAHWKYIAIQLFFQGSFVLFWFEIPNFVFQFITYIYLSLNIIFFRVYGLTLCSVTTLEVLLALWLWVWYMSDGVCMYKYRALTLFNYCVGKMFACLWRFLNAISSDTNFLIYNLHFNN